MHNINYSNQAEEDLHGAISHIAEESIQNAMHYLVEYEEKIELLRHTPLMGTNCKNKHIKRDCRVLIYKSHIIVYQVQEDKNAIFIVRIFHSSVDYANKLNSKKQH